MPKQTKNNQDLLRGILNGNATLEDWKKFHNIQKEENELPFGNPKFESDVLPSRAALLTSLFKWSLACMHNFRKNIPSSLKIAVTCEKGNGASYMSEQLYILIRDYLANDRNTAENASVYMLTKQGQLFQNDMNKQPIVSPGKQAKWIFITDGVFSKSEITPQLADAMAKGAVIAFVNDPNEMYKLYSEDPIILKLPNLTEDEIFRIATLKGLLPENYQEETQSLIRRLLGRDVTPKAAMDYLAASSALSHDKIGVSQKRIAEPYHIFESIINNNTEINVFDELDPEALRAQLKSEVVGQEEAIDMLVDSIMVMQMGLQDRSRPALIAFFLGQTGTGKTMLGRKLAKAVFGREEIVRIDMSEYSSSVDTHKLFGASPMYVGYGEDTALVRAVKRRKKGIILFDEIEKAHDQVRNAMLQMLDYGHFTSGNGQKYDITGYIIILTSNSLADTLLAGKTLGFEGGSQELTPGRLRRELENTNMFRPEFVNRLDAVIAFRPISEQTAALIARNQLRDLANEVANKIGSTVKYDDSYIEAMVSKRDPKYGGRDIYRLVQAARRHLVKMMLDDPGKKEYVLSIPKEASAKTKYLNEW